MEDILNSSEEQSGSNYTICFAGNITPSALQNEYEKSKGYSYHGVFENILGLLRNSNLTVANLEGCFVNEDPGEIKRNSFLIPLPEKLAPILKYSGIDALSMANNHTYDYGMYGLQRNRQFSLMYKMEHFGSMGKNFFIKNNFQIYGFTTHINQGWTSNISRYLRNVTDYKFIEGKVPIAYIHWGSGKQMEPQGEQKYIASDFIKQGFKLIIGHGPHRAQRPYAIVDGVPIIFSLGDLYSNNIDGINDGYIVLVTFKGKILTKLERYRIRCKVARSGATRIHKISRENLI